jgi:4-hydroxy-tetrahydrodipicolinate synthase
VTRHRECVGMYRPTGVMAAIVTPMFNDERLNLTELKNHVNRVIDKGVHGVFCLGTNGEFYTMSQQERIEVIETVVDAADGRVPVLAGVGAISTQETIRLTRIAESLHVQAVSVITPYFVPLSQAELIRHYRSVADATSLPVMLYNIPMRTGNHIEAQTVAELARVANIVGIKDSSGKLVNLTRYIESCPEDFAVFSGNDSIILDGLKSGAKGAIAAIANICPDWVSEIYDAWKRGDEKSASAAQTRVNAVRAILSGGNPNTMVKKAVNLLGFPVGPAREPVSGDCDAAEAHVRNVLESVGLLPTAVS